MPLTVSLPTLEHELCWGLLLNEWAADETLDEAGLLSFSLVLPGVLQPNHSLKSFLTEQSWQSA